MIFRDLLQSVRISRYIYKVHNNLYASSPLKPLPSTSRWISTNKNALSLSLYRRVDTEYPLGEFIGASLLSRDRLFRSYRPTHFRADSRRNANASGFKAHSRAGSLFCDPPSSRERRPLIADGKTHCNVREEREKERER